jgi:hypothetical protein
MTLKDVINNPNRKMGHAFVLIMMLTGVLEECLWFERIARGVSEKSAGVAPVLSRVEGLENRA